MATPTIDQFLNAISGFTRFRNSSQIQKYILVEPPLPEIYANLTAELHRSFPKGNSYALEQKCNALLPEDLDRAPGDELGTSWPAFVSFMKEYLDYLRDVNVNNLVETHQLLSNLVNHCITALSNPSMGLVILPTCLSLSTTLAKLAVNLERRPELTAHLMRRNSVVNVDDDQDSKKTLVEGTAELLQRGFTMCLTDRTSNVSGLGRDGLPEGKKIGIYSIANLVLKLLFQCRKTRLASQIFTNITQHSPPLAAFPAPQRVTYLYYLGRFCFSSNHFSRAQVALHAAYDQCHTQAVSQRALILTYLVTVNIILGRFPSEALYRRPEARGLSDRFLPICHAIRKGDVSGFRKCFEGEHKRWFLARGILLPLRNRCEVLIWRTLARKTFLINGVPGGESRRAPTFSLTDMLHLARFLERQSPPSRGPAINGRVHTNSIFRVNNAPTSQENTTFVDPDLSDASSDSDSASDHYGTAGVLPTLLTIEAILASLIDQGLLHGFLSHKQRRFAILGAKTQAALSAGFPPVWSVLGSKPPGQVAGQSVPGWVREERRLGGAGGKFGPGMVVNLSGARPAGSAM
ncbi:MAG: hypothetical protein M1825_001589 [Sarcosagium campestre]|nr:MAG: hypothetical protein M1825_001589 [Sarcosagium campestre]